ncbi:MAG TPA: DUF1015 domain-containing protein [Chloroflexota bacterium]|jgi:uncharacterized protein (DUF1015 family)|nr:DUF1015 domain-containing protein [Chloroflexota bacterium]
MAEVAPMPGLRFRDVPLADVLAPPFDVISPEQQATLYERSPYNVVRLELGREADRYAQARRTYEGWRASGALRQDPPSFYLYEQRFTAPDGAPERARRALIARVRLEPWSAGVILPHESTHDKAKADRLQLMRAIQANVSPVFGLSRSMPVEWPGGAPQAEATDEAGVTHRLWVAPSEPFMLDEQIVIADGHHRYETALAYRDERRAQGSHAADFVMIALVAFDDPGLVVLPTHRLLHSLTPAQLQRLSERLGDYFDVEAAAEAPSPRATQAALDHLAGIDAPAVALYGPLPSGLRVLKLNRRWAGRAFDESKSAAWNGLDVSVVHGAFERILGISPEDAAGERYVRYEQSPQAAIRAVQRGDAQLALLLRPTPAAAVREVAIAGDKMPQKSTYFYPKLGTGVVLNPLDGE